MLLDKQREDFGGDFGEVGMVGGGVTEADAVAFDLQAVDFWGVGRGGVLADNVAAGEERVVAGLRFLRAGDGAEAASREESAETARAADEGRRAAAEPSGEIAERGERDQARVVEGGVGLVEW